MDGGFKSPRVKHYVLPLLFLFLISFQSPNSASAGHTSSGPRHHPLLSAATAPLPFLCRCAAPSATPPQRYVCSAVATLCLLCRLFYYLKDWLESNQSIFMDPKCEVDLMDLFEGHSSYLIC